MRSVPPLVTAGVMAALAACSIDKVRFQVPAGVAVDAAPDAPPATCTDRTKNGDEADVDCGGSCPACGDGARCGADGDCDSGLCGAQVCVRVSSCAEILARGFARGDGTYHIDPDGVGGEPAFAVACDMTTDGGGWTRFNWVTASYPVNGDPLELSLSQCAVTDAVCRARIPASAVPVNLMVKDLGDHDVALWRFDAGNQISNAVLGALRDKTQACLAQRVPWQPYFYSGTEAFCGTGGEGGCDSFVYVNTTLAGCSTTYTGWYVELDGDTGCYNAAFKIGMTHTGYETIGCEMPDVNYLDDGPTTLDDNVGELYYR